MNQYEITTAQNVTIRLTIANMGDRILAAVIDILILTGYLLLVSYIENKLVIGYSMFLSRSAFWVTFCMTLPIYFYSLIFEYFLNGQTPGKRLRKIKVVRMDGESLTLGNCIIRWLFRLVDIWFDWGSVAIVTATFSRLHQRIGDMLAGTIVISTRNDKNIDQSIYVEQDPTGVVMFPQAERLDLSDIEIVNEALRLYYEGDEFEFVLLVSAQLKKVMDVMPEMDDLTFIKRVVTDYNLLHRVPIASENN
jgi:uncharacterized RDD family membrane protein YckC